MMTEDLHDVVVRCKKRYKKVKELTEFLYIFRQEMTRKMKKWGVWKPLVQVKCYGVKQEDGSIDYEQYTLWNMWSDPNFWDECHIGGLLGNGFNCRFNDQDGIEIYSEYRCETGFRFRLAQEVDQAMENYGIVNK